MHTKGESRESTITYTFYVHIDMSYLIFSKVLKLLTRILNQN